jgi:formylglycine-generating enzyme required for sulfatase activity
MAINLESPYDVKYYVSSNAVPGGATGSVYKTTHMLMRKIPAAYVEFRMGTGIMEQGLTGGNYNDLPHAAMLTKDFYIGVYEITQKQMALMGGTRTSGGPKTDEDADILPSNGMVFNTLRGGCGENPTAVSPIGMLAGNSGVATLDIPFEAQWEFACRGGTLRRAPSSSQATQMYEEMWVSGNNDGKIHAVGTRKPNPYGLYDMLGNLWELCKDKFAAYEFTSGVTSVDPFVLTDGTSVVRRGGGYANDYKFGGCGARVTASPTSDGWDYGYRLSCDAVAY